MIPKKDQIRLKKEVKKLKRREKDLIIADFDDTIFSTKLLIENDYRDWRRGQEWNNFIIENNLIDKIIKEVYANTDYPKTISSKLREGHDIILSAWIEEFQIKKRNATWLNNIEMIVVNKPEEKIVQVVSYIMNKLKYLPSKIIIYEDRPKFFIEFKYVIEDLLWIPVEIMLVEMIDNQTEPKIIKID